MEALFFALVAGVPLLIAPRFFFYFDVIPRIVLLLAAAAAAIIMRGVWRSPATGTSKRFLTLAALQGTVAVLATIASVDRGVSLLGGTWRKEGLLVELAILTVAVATFNLLSAEPGRVRFFLRLAALVSILIAVYGIAQYFGIDPLLPSAAYHFGDGQFTIVRPPSTLGHAAYFASYLLFAVFAAVALMRLETGMWKAVAIAAAVAGAFAIVLSGTRAAILGLIAGALFLVLREGRSTLRKAAVGFTVTFALLVAFYVSPPGAHLRARMHWSSDDRLGGARLLLWRDTLRMSGARRISGYGPETFAVEFPKHESLELARAFPDFYHESPHNILLDALVSDGVAGLALLLAWTIFGLTLARGAIGAAFMALLVSQQFTSFMAATELYFYLSLALLAANAVGPAVERAPRAIVRWALAAPFVCFAFYLGAGDASLASSRAALERGDIARAEQKIHEAHALHASADLYFSRAFLAVPSADPVSRLRAWSSALACARSATHTADDRMNAFLNLASFYAGAGDVASVETSLRSAIAAAPNWYKPHRLLAQVLALEGRNAQAAGENTSATDRDSPAAETSRSR